MRVIFFAVLIVACFVGAQSLTHREVFQPKWMHTQPDGIKFNCSWTQPEPNAYEYGCGANLTVWKMDFDVLAFVVFDNSALTAKAGVSYDGQILFEEAIQTDTPVCYTTTIYGQNVEFCVTVKKMSITPKDVSFCPFLEIYIDKIKLIDVQVAPKCPVEINW